MASSAAAADPGARRAPRAGRVGAALRERISTMHPAYFALSMATGIVSIAGHLLGLADLSAALFWINLVAYVALWGATGARALLFRREFVADWSSHQRAPGFFTPVAATCVLGSQFALLRGLPDVAFALWVVAVVLWVIATYTVFVALSVREDKPALEQGINGGWLVGVVATQAICVLGTAVLPERVSDRDAALFVLTAFWLAGGMLYIWLISLIFYRYTFFRLGPTDVMPPYWINMGAVAISTLAGASLLGAAGDSSFMAGILPFVKGFTVLYWATATWWIPLLVVLGIWRHVVRRVPIQYDPLYWGLVFPLGMYSVCTWKLVQAFELGFLVWVARGFIVAGIVAWLLAFSGWATRLLQLLVLALRSRPRVATSPQAPSLDLRALEPAGAPHPTPGEVA
ncbi:MAG: tellurite resistance/C4-dicarboxylate transporter family protein [Polyangiaceae bacterium]|nr:tellurite resistance/C4-dicarboxylate transporter family protein [Polyangiaceae bacterium]